MSRFAASLRGVSPANLRMAQIKECLEAAGYSQVKTLLSSGNVAFDTQRATSMRQSRSNQ